MNFQTNEKMMIELKESLSLIKDLAPYGSKIAYMDYPIHFNIGDLLIYLGTLEFFTESGYQLVHAVSDKADESLSLIELDNDVIVFMHGGGNFGDIYPKHQNLREKVVEKYHRNKVIILPQSIHFRSDTVMRNSAALFKRHNDLHLICRDKESLKIANHFSDKLYLLPDMAHCLWGSQNLQTCIETRKNPKNASILIQNRIDGENADPSFFSAYSNYELFDWYDNIPVSAKVACSIISRFQKLKISQSYSIILEKIWRHFALLSAIYAARKVNSHSFFVTNRLHGHIFSLLLSVRHTSLDNNYGKVSRYISAWTNKSAEMEVE